MQFDDEFRKSWLASNEKAIQSHGTMHRANEMPGVSALVLNLTHISLKALAGLEPESAEAKEHAGVRVTFAILRILSPGFSAYQPDANENGKRKGGRGGGSSGPKERYGRMEGDSVALHSFELMNKKGVYSKGARSEEFVMLSPGMVISNIIFGNKMQQTFGKDCTAEEIPAFRLAVVQLGTSNITAKGAENGMLLQIRSFLPLMQYTPSSPRMVPPGLLQSSVQAATQQKDAFLAGCMVPEAQKQNANMSLIRVSISGMFNALDVGYIEMNHGTFAVSATGSIRFHVTSPIADVTPKIFDVMYDERDFGTADVQWISKLLNVAVLLKAVRLLVALDGYRNNSLEPEVSIC